MIDQVVNFGFGKRKSQGLQGRSQLVGDGAVAILVVKGEGNHVVGHDLVKVFIQEEVKLELCVVDHGEHIVEIGYHGQLLDADLPIAVRIVMGQCFLEFGNLQSV